MYTECSHVFFLRSLLQLVEWGLNGPGNLPTTPDREHLLTVSEDALAEIEARMLKGGFPSDVAVRISPTKWADAEVEISFDFPVSDATDWCGVTRALYLLVDRRDEEQLLGCQLDFCDGTFSVRLV